MSDDVPSLLVRGYGRAHYVSLARVQLAETAGLPTITDRGMYVRGVLHGVNLALRQLGDCALATVAEIDQPATIDDYLRLAEAFPRADAAQGER